MRRYLIFTYGPQLTYIFCFKTLFCIIFIFDFFFFFDYVLIFIVLLLKRLKFDFFSFFYVYTSFFVLEYILPNKTVNFKFWSPFVCSLCLFNFSYCKYQLFSFKFYINYNYIFNFFLNEFNNLFIYFQFLFNLDCQNLQYYYYLLSRDLNIFSYQIFNVGYVNIIKPIFYYIFSFSEINVVKYMLYNLNVPLFYYSEAEFWSGYLLLDTYFCFIFLFFWHDNFYFIINLDDQINYCYPENLYNTNLIEYGNFYKYYEFYENYWYPALR